MSNIAASLVAIQTSPQSHCAPVLHRLLQIARRAYCTSGPFATACGKIPSAPSRKSSSVT
jgi:hypothetical protein